MPTRSVMAFLLCIAFGAAIGQPAAQKPPQVVQARMVLGMDAVHAGTSIRTAAVARIAEGFHINAHHPSLDYLIPTELKLETSPKLSIEKLVYPEGELKTFAFSDTPLSVYQGSVVVGALVKVARATPPGEYSLKGKFSYQACNDHACLPPTSVPVVLTVKVVGKRVPLKPVNREVFEQIHFN